MTKSLISRAMSQLARRRTPEQRKGAPKSADRCPCGAMTRTRAAKRNHKCA